MPTRTNLAVVLAIAALVLSVQPLSAVAAEPTDIVELNLPKQPLDRAVTDLATQAGLAIGGNAALLRGKQAPALNGSYTVEQALRQLLAGSGLEARFDGQSGVTLIQSPVDPGPIQLSAIVVEGEKIGRTLGETPAATVLILGEEAEAPQHKDLRDTIKGIPNVVVEEGAFLPSIRGIDGSAGQIGGSAFSTGTQPRVNILIDGVARPTDVGSSSTLSSAWDIDNIEIARGPQSTLTGRNSIAGAIRVSTADPVFDHEAAVRTRYFDQNGTIGGAIMINTPLIEDQVAIRIAGEASDGETFTEIRDPAVADVADELEDEEFRQLRGKIRVTPKSVAGLDAQLTVERIESRRLFEPGIIDRGQDSLVLTDFGNNTSVEKNTQTVVLGELSYELSEKFTVEGLAAFLDNRLEILPFAGFLDLQQETESITAEARVRISDMGILEKGLVGVVFENQKELGINNPALFDIKFDGEITSIGIFAEGEFPLTPKLTLIAGGRFEDDKRDRIVQVFGAGQKQRLDETAFIPKAGFRYDISRDIAAGYLFTTGFRPGGVDVDLFNPAAGVARFDAERLSQHEVWARGRTFNDRLGFTASAFYYKFEDAQAGGAAENGSGLTGNLPSARGIGLELAVDYELTDNLTLSSALGLLDTKITDAGPVVPQFEGDELPRAPKVTASAGVTYLSPLGFDVSAKARYVGSNRSFLNELKMDDYVVVDFAAGYETGLFGATDLRIDAFIENVQDERYVVSDFRATAQTVGRPRTFGIAATLRF